MKTILKPLVAVLGLVFTLSACHQEEITDISKEVVHTANPITSENLSGTIKGTLLAGKTYYFSSDLTVNDGDTLLLQSGVHLIAVGDGISAATAPEIFMHGTFISLGTKENPNYITVKNADQLHSEAAAQNYTNVFFGWWGGITCTPAASAGAAGGDVIIKWTHIEFGGAPSGPNDDPAIYSSTSRFSLYFGNHTKNLIIEDSWFFGSKDDNMQIGGGNVSIMRNTFELCGAIGGEFYNMKTGTVGDIAYNVFIGSCTNATKISNSGGTSIQCNATVYNNTIIDGGFRQSKPLRGGSIDFEKGARGLCYNNLIVNSRFGLRVTGDADIPNVHYGNNFFYGYSQTLVDQFYADSAPAVIAAKAASDVRSDTPQQNNPMFYNFDVNKYDYAANPGPVTNANVQPPYTVMIGTSSFRLLGTSPALGKGKTDFSPLNAVTTTGDFGTTITPPGKDIGAYQNDGTGNQH